MTQSMSRQQRRAMERAALKSGSRPQAPQSQLQGHMKELIEDLQRMNEQIVRVVEFNKRLFQSLQILREACERKGVIVPSDIAEVEELYRQSFSKRQVVMKEVLSSSKSDQEKIELCLEEITTYKPGYDKMNLNPVRDLNVSPAVVNDYLIENGFTGEQYKRYAIQLGVPEPMLLTGEFPGFKSNAANPVPGTNPV